MYIKQLLNFDLPRNNVKRNGLEDRIELREADDDVVFSVLSWGEAGAKCSFTMCNPPFRQVRKKYLPRKIYQFNTWPGFTHKS
jgi:tRNA1(Val) A37 N6-methylase TrmN6